MKKVLFLCYYFPPMGMGGTQRSAKFVKYLPKYNWEPIVLTVKDVHYYAHDMSLLHEISNCKIYRTESYDPLRLLARLMRTSSNDKNGIKSTIPNLRSKFLNWLNQFTSGGLLIPDSKILWLPFALKSTLPLIREYKIEIIYTTSPPHSAHLGGLLLKLATGIKWIADFRDDWTGGESQPNPSIIHTFVNRLMEKFVLKIADRVIGMCDHLTQSLSRKSGHISKNKKFLTIMNGYDREDFSGLENLPLNSRFTITHCGSISRVSDPEPFLKAVKFLFQQHPKLKDQILIQFFGIDIYGRLDYVAQSLGLEQNISQIRYLSHREALKEIMQSHLLLLTIFKRTNEEIITGKLFEYLASGKPILLISSEGEVARIVRVLDRGVVVKNHDIQGIQNAILTCLQKYQEGRSLFSDPLSIPQFDRERLTGKLAEVFSELTSMEIINDKQIKT
ncbi:MAG: glycosyltransferase [bacterium]|nr:MAG: glycosyltransferase [bacterium]